MPISYFFGEDPDELAEDAPVFSFVATEEGIDLNSAFSQLLDAEKRLLFIDLVDYLGELHSQLGAASLAQAVTTGRI